MTPEDKTKQYYDAYAQSFADSRKNMHWKEVEMLQKYIGATTQVLDVGCGSGRLLRHISLKPSQYVGVDYAKEMIAMAELEHPEFVFQVQDICDGKFEKKRYDVVACIAMLHHLTTIDAQYKAVCTMFDALVDGGVLFMTNWNVACVGVPAMQCVEVRDGVVGNLTTASGHTRVYYQFSKQQLTSLLERVGFEVIFSAYMRDGVVCDVTDGNNIVHVAKK